MIPLILDLADKRVIVFGAGNVGLRKAQHFSELRMTIVSRSIHEDIFKLKMASIKQMDLLDIEDEDLEKLIERHDFVIAALSDKTQNERIILIAKKLGKLFNSATGDANFFIPSVVKGDEYLIAISTKGKSPAVPKYIRERLEEEFAGLDQMILLQNTLREHLKEKIPEQKDRAEILRNILHDEKIWEACTNGNDPQKLLEKYL